MMQDVVDSHNRRQLDTIDAPIKEQLGRHASRQIDIPNDIVIKGGPSGLPENSSNTRTLATMTETFTATSDDQEDTTLMTSSLAYIDSFEVHEGLNFGNPQARNEEHEEETVEDLNIETKVVTIEIQDNNRTFRSRWPNDFGRSKYNPPVQRPLAAPSLFSSGSGDSWDDQNRFHRGISLLDMVDSRDDEEDGGHDGDDERESPVAVEDLRRSTLQFQQSQDTLSPVNHAFQGALPKFAQGPLSHLRDDSKTSLAQMPRTLRTSSFSTNSSYGTTPRSESSRRNSRGKFIKSVEKLEKNKKEKKNEHSIMEKKGLFESLKELIYCVPGNGGK